MLCVFASCPLRHLLEQRGDANWIVLDSDSGRGASWPEIIRHRRACGHCGDTRVTWSDRKAGNEGQWPMNEWGMTCVSKRWGWKSGTLSLEPREQAGAWPLLLLVSPGQKSCHNGLLHRPPWARRCLAWAPLPSAGWREVGQRAWALVLELPTARGRGV